MKLKDNVTINDDIWTCSNEFRQDIKLPKSDHIKVIPLDIYQICLTKSML